ncbi:MAG: hypothetical protein J6S49_01980 [Erysipelotrichaceae bacterium]|nr:hypothetical protein [Erysipelotrichaceae bacterium]
MAYSGYLIKVGNYTLPTSLIRAETYTVFKSVTDLDSYVDANGILHRNALEHIANKVEFETIPLLSNVEFASLMNNLYSQMSDTLERKASVTLYIPETDSYVTQDMYMPDIKPTLYFADDEKIQYNQIRLAFIGY